MLRLADRFEGQWIYKAMEYRTTNIEMFNNLVHAIAYDLKVPEINVIKLINTLERGRAS